MGKDKLADTLLSQPQAAASSPNLGEQQITLAAEEGASLSSGNMRLYAVLSGSSPKPSSSCSYPKLGEGDHPQGGGGVCGCVDLYNYDPLNRRAAVGIMVATEYRRQGFGLAMLRELERMYSTKIHCLYADIASVNTASLALFKKAGYVQCGHFKEWLEYDSHFIDTVRMQLIL